MGIYGRVILKVEVRTKKYWSEIIHDDRRQKEIETFGSQEAIAINP